VNLNIKVSKILYQWILLLNPFCFCETQYLNFTTPVFGHGAITPFLGGLLSDVTFFVFKYFVLTYAGAVIVRWHLFQKKLVLFSFHECFVDCICFHQCGNPMEFVGDSAETLGNLLGILPSVYVCVRICVYNKTNVFGFRTTKEKGNPQNTNVLQPTQHLSVVWDPHNNLNPIYIYIYMYNTTLMCCGGSLFSQQCRKPWETDAYTFKK